MQLVLCCRVIQVNSKELYNIRKYWRARPARAELFNVSWYCRVLRSLSVVNPSKLRLCFHSVRHPACSMQHQTKSILIYFTQQYPQYSSGIQQIGSLGNFCWMLYAKITMLKLTLLIRGYMFLTCFLVYMSLNRMIKCWTACTRNVLMYWKCTNVLEQMHQMPHMCNLITFHYCMTQHMDTQP